MCKRVLPLIVLLGWSGVQVTSQERTVDWPRWRGPSSNGTVTTAKRIFDQPFELRVRWKRTLGAGYSGIVVSGGRAVTMFSDGQTDFLVALSSDAGQEAWRIPLGPTFPAKDGSTGGPVSTPAIHDGTVFAVGPRGTLVAARLADGRQAWTRDLVKDFGAIEPHWGFTTSPLPTGDVVVVAAGGTRGQAIVALDRTTGAVRWKAGDDTVSYQSPMLATIGGRDLVVAGTERYLFGLDPQTGAEAWRHEHGGTGFFGRIVNPVLLGQNRLLLTYKPDSSILIEPGGGSPREVWTTRELKLNYATPVVHDGLVFGYSGAFLTAIDAATGALKWRSRPPGDGFPILVDDHLVVFTKQGQLAVAAASGDGFVPKASIEVLSQLSWTPPSFADGRIFVRDSYEGIAAVDVVPSRRTTTPAPAPRRGVVPGTTFAAWVAEVEKAPDGAARVEAFLAKQSTVPVIEGDRYAHILFKGDGKDLLVRSDALGTGVDWPLHRVGETDLYYVSLELEPDARISYQFVRSLGETLADPRNPAKATSQNFAGEVSLLLMPGADRTLPAAGTLRGKIVDLEFDTGTATAGHLRWGGKRPVHVYLPPGYDADPARRFPVVYVMYGEEMRTDGRLAVALEAEMGQTIEEALIVFVPSASAYEYARSFREPHLKMMAERLVPWIDGQFRTRSIAADRVLLGGDEAGFAAVEIGLRHPQVFGRIAAQSLFPLSSGDTELLALIDRAPKSEQRYYVDWGRYDPRRRSDNLDVRDFSARVHARLKARGFTVAGREWNDGSTVLFWSARAVGAMRELLPVRR